VRDDAGVDAIRIAALQQIERHLVILDQLVECLGLLAVGIKN
jgi:hypothetical protein